MMVLSPSSSSSKDHLKHLLTQDQEPFILSNHIHDKRLHLKKQNPITQNSTNLCKHVCFNSFHAKSPPKTPNTNTIYVHIPANTAALLLEAALRIQKQSEKPPKSAKNLKFGFLGSFLKKLRRRRKSEIAKRGCEDEVKVSVKDILRWESNDVREKGREEELETNLCLEEKRELCLSCNSNSRVSSVNWTEKSIDLETSTSGCYDDEEDETEFVVQNGEFGLFEEVTSFRVFPQNGSSPCSLEFVSPATSPQKTQVAKNEEGHVSSNGKEQKEEDWYSPVSVLDLQTEDNVEEQDDYSQEDEDDSELERSFAIVQKAKQKFLKKLRRFERLAGLDPLELEKRIAEDDNESEDDEDFDDVDDENDDSVLQDNEHGDLLIGQALNKSHCSSRRIPFDMKRLVIELMNEKGTAAELIGSVRVKNKCSKRLGSMENVEQNRINMMVQMELRGEWNDCQKKSECVEETVGEVELAIFGFLVEEFVAEYILPSDLKVVLELV